MEHVTGVHYQPGPRLCREVPGHLRGDGDQNRGAGAKKSRMTAHSGKQAREKRLSKLCSHGKATVSCNTQGYVSCNILFSLFFRHIDIASIPSHSNCHFKSIITKWPLTIAFAPMQNNHTGTKSGGGRLTL